MPDLAGVLGVGAGGVRDGERGVLPSRMTFSVTNDYPERIVEVDEGRHRAIGMSGNSHIYSILALNMGRGDMEAASIVKAVLVDSILGELDSGDSLPPEMVANAYKLALAEFQKYETGAQKDVLAYLVAHDVVGLGAFGILLEDSQNIEEIEVNAPSANIVLYHSKYGRCRTNLRLNGEREFRFSINRVIRAAGRELNSLSPVIDTQLTDGSRVHAQLWPYSNSGAAASIRLNNGKGMDLKRLIATGTASSEALAYLWMAIDARMSMVIAGAPAAGKTSFLVALHALFPAFERVLTIEEDVNELRFYSNLMNVVSLKGSTRKGDVQLRDQVINALHMRPERLIVGEMRGGEAREAFAGANLGVPFMTTVHSSENGMAILGRLSSKPMDVERHTLSMLDVSVLMKRLDGSKRLMESIVEYGWLCRAETIPEDLNDDTFGVKTVYLSRNGVMDQKALKESKVMKAYADARMESVQCAVREMKRRAKFLDGMDGIPEGTAKVYEYVSGYEEK